MRLYVRLHNSEAGTGLLRHINLLSSHTFCGGQTSRCWPWSPGSINHGTGRQKWCRTEHARQSTYQSLCVQGWGDPRWQTPLIILNNTVPVRFGCLIALSGFAVWPLRNASFRLCFLMKMHFGKSVTQIRRLQPLPQKQWSELWKTEEGFAFCTSTLVFHEIDSFMATGGLFLSSFSALSLRDWDCCCTKWPKVDIQSIESILFPFGHCFCCLVLSGLRRTGTHPAGQRRVAQTCTLRKLW